MFSFLFCVLAAMWSDAATRAAELVLQKGHDGQLLSVAISPDGRYLASAALGDPIKLWQAKRGEFVRDLPSSRNELPLAWSPGGGILLTRVRDGAYTTPQDAPRIRARAMPSGQVIRGLPDMSIPFFFNGKIIRETDGMVLRDWNFADGKLISTRTLMSSVGESTSMSDGKAPPLALTTGRSLQDDVNDRSRRFAFSRNGKYLMLGGEYGYGKDIARVWDARNGHLLHEVHKKDASSGLAAVSNDGRWMVTQTGSENSSQDQFKMRLWDLKTEKQVHSWPGGYYVLFSRDGQRVFSGGHSGGDVWDVRSGKHLKSVQASGTYSLSENERLWASGDLKGLRISSVATGKVLRTMPGTLTGAKLFSWSPDGKYLAGGADGHLRVWDMRRGALLNAPTKEHSYVERARWKNDTTLQTENLQSARFWNVGKSPYEGAILKAASQKQISPRFPNDPNSHLEYGYGVFLSPNGQTLISNSHTWNLNYNRRGTLYVWDGTGQVLLRSLQIENEEDGSRNFEVRWLPDSVRFIVPTRRGLETWNAQSGKRENTIEMPVPISASPPAASYIPLQMLAVSPDGKYVATQSGDASRGIGVWDVATSRLLSLLPAHLARNAAFSPDGETLAAGTGVWHWRHDPQAQATLLFNTGSLDTESYMQEETLAWSPDGKRIAVGKSDKIEVFNAPSGRLLARLAISSAYMNSDDHDWVVWTPEGLFNAPDKGRKRMRWMENGELIPLDSPRDQKLRKKFFQPVRVEEILQDTSAPR